MSDKRARIERVARNIFHFPSLRPGQIEAIESVLSGHDTLVVMPTGSGKSAIYQIPALMLEGPTIVVSPLIALQKDQAEFLDRHKTGGVAVVNSLQPASAQEEALEDAEAGEKEFLFMAPEQFANTERLEAVKAVAPSLFVVDEAHCISEWGHSFRPDYLRLASVIEELGHPVVLALTATANAHVREEIKARLAMRDAKTFVHGFDRPNIWLGVETAASEDKKRAMLLERVRDSPRPGIIYAATRRHAQEINDELNNIGVASGFYHGGLKKADRDRMQEQFMNDEIEVIVATSAFGMGVDKPNVRFVFHFEAPDSIDSYYQEIGRAGRDGDPAFAVLYYRAGDLRIHKFFKGGGQLKTDDLQRVLNALEGRDQQTEAELQKESRLSKTKFARAINRLEETGAIARDAQGTVRRTAPSVTLAEKAEEASNAQSQLHEAELERIEQMRLYAENLECRRTYLLSYFGEETPERCGHCDNCEGAGTERARLIAETKVRAATESIEP